ncbi:omega-amidase NIT2-like [Eupeodes corollae]|uniref:omega-amidase NIT2-like n=1 Tax=Eupeodes corollae TaxID=290404 RepID=UPI002490A705|nr:omega-amidase NIT2-like [Eupeodes corollae]
MSKSSNMLRLALLQLKVSKDKVANVQNALKKITQVVNESKPRIVALSECFNCPYGTNYFREYSETIPDGYTCKALSESAKQHGIYIIGGTIPEMGENDAIYNTCTIWDPKGNLIGKHRKVHLFDIDIPGGIRFKESETLSAGNKFTIVEFDGHKVGIGICYDIRFEEMARIYRNNGCEMLIYPAAFNMTTGPMHWELLQRSRANDNQLYVASISPSRDETAGYVAYGHSMVVDPWAKILASAKEKEEVVIADLDFSIVEKVRQQIPISTQRRTDLYTTTETNKV